MPLPLGVAGEPSLHKFMTSHAEVFKHRGRVEKTNGRFRLRWRERTAEGRTVHRSKDLANSQTAFLAGIFLGIMRHEGRREKLGRQRTAEAERERRQELWKFKHKIHGLKGVSKYHKRRLVRITNEMAELHPWAAPQLFVAQFPQPRRPGRSPGLGGKYTHRDPTKQAALW